MRKVFVFVGNKIRSAIDFFYPPFKPYMSVQFFRYGVTGGANLLFDWVVYFFIFNYVLQKQMLNLGIITMSSHIATFALKFPVVFSGFLLQKYVTYALQMRTCAIVPLSDCCAYQFDNQLCGLKLLVEILISTVCFKILFQLLPFSSAMLFRIIILLKLQNQC